MTEQFEDERETVERAHTELEGQVGRLQQTVRMQNLELGRLEEENRKLMRMIEKMVDVMYRSKL